MRDKTIAMVLGGVLLVIATAGASVLVMNNKADEVPTTHRTVTSSHTVRTTPAAPAPARTATRCNDGNVAGKVVGGVGGGVLGSMVGKGNGKTAATIGGTLGGAYIGGETIPLNGVTCPR